MFLREPTPPLPEAVAAELDLPVDSSQSPPASETHAPGAPELITMPDKFGVYRVYQYLPSCEPDQEIKLEHLADSPHIAGAEPRSRPGWWFGFGSVINTIFRQRTTADCAPFLNPTTMALMQWYYQNRRSTISLASIQRLVDDVIFSSHWNREDLRGFKARKATQDFDKARDAPRPAGSSQAGTSKVPFTSADGWHQSYVQFWLPKTKKKGDVDIGQNLKHMTVGPVWHRKIMKVLEDAIQNPKTGPDMHLTPFRMYWSPDAAHDNSSSPPQPPPTFDNVSSSSSSRAASESDDTSSASSDDDSPSSATPSTSSLPYGGERLYGEVYVGDAMNREHEEIRETLRKTHKGPEPLPETVVAAILLYSDSTHLAQFGTASLWPAYGWFANWTKYDRGKPSSFAAHHLAYIPSVRHHIKLYLPTEFISHYVIAALKLSRCISGLVQRCNSYGAGHLALQTRTYAGRLEPSPG